MNCDRGQQQTQPADASYVDVATPFPMPAALTWPPRRLTGSTWSLPSSGIQNRDHAPVAIHAEHLAGGDDVRGAADVDDGGNAVLAGDDRAVGRHAAPVHDHAGGRQEVGGPRRIRDRGNQDLVWLNMLAVACSGDDTDLRVAERGFRFPVPAA